MKVLVTGASGFLGTAVVNAAIAAGHHVVAMVRPAADPNFAEHPNLQLLRGDLRQPSPWSSHIQDIEVVVHLAAAVSGDLPQQFAGTVATTENLLENLPLNSLRRFVHISSFSVYDFSAVARCGTLTEATPLESKPELRDAYTTAKLAQEALVRARCEATGLSHVVLRPGAIYGPGKAWDFGRTLVAGRLDFIFSPGAAMRLTYVGNCAAAIVKAIDADVPSGSTFNIVDDDLPTHLGYYRLCKRMGAATGWPVPVPWVLVALGGRLVELLNRYAFSDRARVPEFLAYRRQQVRWKPIFYRNDPAKRDLGWIPAVSINDGARMTITTDFDAESRG